MAGSVNKAILIGNLGRDPEVRSFASGSKVVNLSVATSESWKDKQTGERKERTEWHRVSITNDGLARVAEQYLRKGSKVYVEGQIETRKWQDQSGQDRYSTEIVLRPYNGVLTILSGGAGADDHDNSPRGHDRHDQERSNAEARRNASQYSDMDDEIPF